MLKGIEKDVPFDSGTAEQLIAACEAVASLIDGQRGSRSSWQAMALTDFRGRFSEIFRQNGHTEAADASELAGRLREVAQGARRLKEEAEKEQRRRQVAREWEREQEDRNILQEAWDDVFGSEPPPVGPAAEPPTIPVAPPRSGQRDTPAPGDDRGGMSGTSSARPADLRSFARNSRQANDGLRGKPGELRRAYHDFQARCRWGTLSADGVFTGLDCYLRANDEDERWISLIADAFARAGGVGEVSTVANSALTASLRAHGVAAQRQDLSIEPPTAYGNPPTTGYANDPVNTSTGNFVENEVDLGFAGPSQTLSLRRTHNSCSDRVGAFGPGWGSWAEARLTIDVDGARVALPDGREVVFPRHGDGWARALGENLWLGPTGRDGPGEHDGLTMTVTGGTHWDFGPGGRLRRTWSGPGSTVWFHHDGDRLTRMEHECGRAIDLVWEGDRVTEAVASDGRTVRYRYDPAGRLVAATGPLGTRTYRWGEDGRMSAVIDADGVVEAENAYDSGGRVVRQRSPFGRVTRFSYLPGRITVVSDEDGERSNTWIADERGRLVGVVDAHGRRQSMSYDPYGNCVLVTDRDGAATVQEYDERGRLVRRVTPSGADVRWTYDDADRVVTATTEPDATTTFGYDGDERNPAVVVDPEGGQTRMTWQNGLLTRVVDPSGVVVTFAHDEHGDVVATSDADGNTARLERDAAGRVVAAITPLGHRTVYAYTHAGLLRSRQGPDGSTWRYEHTPAGRLSAIVDPTGARTDIEHGTHGEPTHTVDGIGRATVSSYDDLGNISAVELADGIAWRYGYDALSRLTETVDPSGGLWTRDYDVVGDVVVAVDPTGVRQSVSADRAHGAAQVKDELVTTGLRFDGLGRLVARQQPDGSSALTRYDRCGRPIELVDELGGRTVLRRDAAGRVVAMTRPSGATVRYEYDRCGRPSAVVDETGAKALFAYDPDGHLVREHYPTGEVAWTGYDAVGRVVQRHLPGVGSTTVGYDGAGRVIETRDGQFGHRRFRYDAASQLVEAIDGNGGTTRYEYDAAGRVVTVVDPAGGRTRRQYDSMGNVVAQTDPLERTTQAGYDAAGRQLWQQDATGDRVCWSYDGSGRLAGLSANGTLLSSTERDVPARRVRVIEGSTVHELAWDPRGLLTERLRDGRGLRWEYDPNGACRAVVHPDGTRTAYERDAAGRLVAVEHQSLGRAVLHRDTWGRVAAVSSGAAAQRWERRDGFVVRHEASDGRTTSHTVVDRDEAGQVTQVCREGVSTEFRYDGACQLVEARRGDSVTRWRYDSCGRLVSETTDNAVRERAYDAAGQLLNTKSGSVVTTYEYDAAGRRVRERGPHGWSREYAWAPTGWLAGLTESSPDGSAYRLPVRVDALGELAWVGDAEVFWDTTDPWSPVLQVGATEVVTAGPLIGTAPTGAWLSPTWRAARSDTDPWSVPTGASLGDGIGVGAAGELTLGGLEWLGARVYDPASRTFLSTDPIDPVVGAGWAGNPYSYAGNDPLNAVDPLGLRPVTDAELQAYRDAHRGLLAESRDWCADNWEYIAAGAMVVAGGVMIATGVGGPVGMGLVSAGIDTGLQKLTTGQVDWGKVAVTGAVGTVAGGAVSGFKWAAQLGQSANALRTTMAVNGVVGAAGNEAVYLWTDRGKLSWTGATGAAVSGGFGGAVGGAAGPVGGTIARRLGSSATSLTATATTFGINAAAGVESSYINGAITGQPTGWRTAALSGVGGGFGGLAASHVLPGRGMTTIEQLPFFGPRSVEGALSFSQSNTQAVWGQAGIGAVGSAISSVVDSSLLPP